MGICKRTCLCSTITRWLGWAHNKFCDRRHSHTGLGWIKLSRWCCPCRGWRAHRAFIIMVSETWGLTLIVCNLFCNCNTFSLLDIIIRNRVILFETPYIYLTIIKMSPVHITGDGFGLCMPFPRIYVRSFHIITQVAALCFETVQSGGRSCNWIYCFRATQITGCVWRKKQIRGGRKGMMDE